MRILFIGDVMGRTGRDGLAKHLPMLKAKLNPDVIIVNGENSAHGLGISEKICQEFYELGVNVITTGNHVWDQREILAYIDRDPNLLRPINFPDGAPGNGYVIYQMSNGQKIMVVNAMARLFMDPMEDPFRMLHELIGKHPMGGQQIQAIFVDFHGEATSEKMALAHYLDGRVSAVVGTHTHLPTADAQVLPNGTAFQGDAGMSGDFDSVIGVRKDISVNRFVRKLPGERMVPAVGEATVCGTFIVTDDKSGLAKEIRPVRIGGRLHEEIPQI